MTKQDQIQALRAENVALKASLAQSETRISELDTRILELETFVLKLSTRKTSRNSHTPPSTDLARKNQSLRGKSDKPVGGQVGHKGHNLAMSDKPDKTEKIYPDFCNHCGLSLSALEFELIARRQVVNIPEIKAEITEIQVFGTACTCGYYQVSAFPEGVINHIQYGKNVQSLVVYQSCYQFVPFHRLQDFFNKICHLWISKGTIENIIRRTAQKAQPAYEALHQVIAMSFFVGSDETGFKVNKAKYWFWVWQNALVTYLVAASTRSKQVIKDTFPDGLPNTILCSDRLAAQLSTLIKGTQICLAHLLRDLIYLIAAEKTDWATDFKTLLKDAIKLKQTLPAYDIKDPTALYIELRANKLLDPAILEHLLKDKVKNKQTITFFRAIIKLREALFPFLYDPRVPFDNNGSEGAIRNVKVKIKISGQFKSLHQEFAVIRSVIDSAIKNGQSVFNAIAQMVNMPMPPKTAG